MIIYVQKSGHTCLDVQKISGNLPDTWNVKLKYVPQTNLRTNVTKQLSDNILCYINYHSQFIGNPFQPSGNDTGDGDDNDDWDGDCLYQEENASYKFDGIVTDGMSSPKFEDTPKDQDET